MTRSIFLDMWRIARAAYLETLEEYAEPLVWLGQKLTAVLHRLPGHTRLQTPEQVLMRQYLLRVAGRMLTPRELHAVLLYYGLVPGFPDLTSEEIASLTGFTRKELWDLRERVFEELRQSRGEAESLARRLKLAR